MAAHGHCAKAERFSAFALSSAKMSFEPLLYCGSIFFTDPFRDHGNPPVAIRLQAQYGSARGQANIFYT